MNVITQFFTRLFNNASAEDSVTQELIRKESEIGRQLFGPIPVGTTREFFRVDERTWVWHEENEQGVKNTKYKVYPKEIVKSINGGHYQKVSLEEAKRLLAVAELYASRTREELYKPILGDV